MSVSLDLKSDFASLFSRYLDYSHSSRRFIRKEYLDTYGSIDGTHVFRYTPTLWIGNEHVGIEWVSETK